MMWQLSAGWNGLVEIFKTNAYIKLPKLFRGRLKRTGGFQT